MNDSARQWTALGLMSGTSLDGIDVGLLTTDGEGLWRPGPFRSYPYDSAMRARLADGLAAATALPDRHARPGPLADLECAITDAHVQAIARFREEVPEAREPIDIIGFHGQTVLHRPEARLTVQLGDGERLAEATGLPVVFDFRADDVAAGGQGAPFVPLFHAVIARAVADHPVAVLNLGGVANLTWIGPQIGAGSDSNGRVIACDTGPGNALLDDWALRHTGHPCDVDGALAASGAVDDEALAALVQHPFFHALPPKSLDRNAFSLHAVNHLSAADGAATLTAFTAKAVALAVRVLPEPPKVWLVAGGGRRNRSLMMALAAALDAPVAPIEVCGLDGDAIEAWAFGYLAVRSARGLPLSLPETTGVAAPQTGGRVIGIGRRP